MPHPNTPNLMRATGPSGGPPGRGLLQAEFDACFEDIQVVHALACPFMAKACCTLLAICYTTIGGKPGMALSFDPHRTAVLSMDYQTVIVSIYVKDPEMMARAAGVLREARRLGMAAIHVRMGFRPKLPEVSTRNKLVGAIK